jgi:hypothetical protein
VSVLLPKVNLFWAEELAAGEAFIHLEGQFDVFHNSALASLSVVVKSDLAVSASVEFLEVFECLFFDCDSEWRDDGASAFELVVFGVKGTFHQDKMRHYFL